VTHTRDWDKTGPKWQDRHPYGVPAEVGLKAGDENIMHLDEERLRLYTCSDHGEGAGSGAALRSGGAESVGRADLREERRGEKKLSVREVVLDASALLAAKQRTWKRRDSLDHLPCFEEPLPFADVIVIGHILHNWSLEKKQTLLAKAYEAIPEGGALIVYGAIIDDDRRENAFGLLMSLNMLIETPGGFDYTSADCASWMREAGFRETRVEYLVGPDSMVVGIKA